MSHATSFSCISNLDRADLVLVEFNVNDAFTPGRDNPAHALEDKGQWGGTLGESLSIEVLMDPGYTRRRDGKGGAREREQRLKVWTCLFPLPVFEKVNRGTGNRRLCASFPTHDKALHTSTTVSCVRYIYQTGKKRVPIALVRRDATAEAAPAAQAGLSRRRRFQRRLHREDMGGHSLVR